MHEAGDQHNAETLQVGEPGTVLSEAVERAALELGPDRSLARIESTTKFVLATVTAVGTVVAAFGALASDLVKDHLCLALPSMVSIALSIALAAWAALGVGDEVDLDDLEDVEAFYRREIQLRSNLARWAGGLLALGVALSVLPAVAAAADDDGPKPHKPRVDAVLERDGKGSALKVSVDAGPVDPNTIATLTACAGKRVVAAGRWVSRNKRHFEFSAASNMSASEDSVQITVEIQQPKKPPSAVTVVLPPPD